MDGGEGAARRRGLEGCAFLRREGGARAPGHAPKDVRFSLENSSRYFRMFNGSLWTKNVRNFIFDGDFERASEMVYKDFSEFPAGERVRVQRMRKLLKEVKSLEGESLPDGYIPVRLSPDDTEALPLSHLPKSLFDLDFGYFKAGNVERLDSTFDADFLFLPEADKEKLRSARFGTWLATGEYSEFRIVKDAYICGSDTRMNAYGFGGSNFVKTASSRMAKVTSKNRRRAAIRSIPCALLLPIPHGPENYYHVMSEMIYGLRYASVTENFPIVYQADHFNILPEVCNRLGINPVRLTPFKDVEDTEFCKAVLPSSPMYFWNKDVTNFFSKIAGNSSAGRRKIYISRRNSSRGPLNELQVEDALRAIGFEVVYPEKMTVGDQIDLFSEALIVVAVHGAGLTNTAFMPAGGAVVELFLYGMLVRDFYMRTRHKKLDYTCIFYNETVEIPELLSRIAKLPVA